MKKQSGFIKDAIILFAITLISGLVLGFVYDITKAPIAAAAKAAKNEAYAVVESPIPIAFTTDVVTASVGHIPSIRTKVGFSLNIPLYKRSKLLFIFPPYSNIELK